MGAETATSAVQAAGLQASDDPRSAATLASAAADLQANQSQAAAGVAAMVAAATAAYDANVVAAAAIDELTAHTADMGLHLAHNRHSAAYDLAGGAGDGLWQSSIGAVGVIDGWIPLPSFQTDSQAIQHEHDWLQNWYGADIGSDDYTAGEDVAGIAAAFVPGVRGAEGLRTGDEAMRGVRSISASERSAATEVSGSFTAPGRDGVQATARMPPSDSPAPTAAEIGVVEAHLKAINALDDHPPNQMMISRIREANAQGRDLTYGEKNFMKHELKEAQLRATGHSQDEAHILALDEHPTYMNYDPEVISEYPHYFGVNWHRAWGLR